MTKLSREKQIAILEALLTKDELAAFLNVKVRVIDNYIEDRLIPYIKIRNSVRFRKSEVEKVLDKLTIRGPRKARGPIETVNQGEVCTK